MTKPFDGATLHHAGGIISPLSLVKNCLVLAALGRLAVAVPVVGRGLYTLREGTELVVSTRTELSSKTARVGDRFDVEVSEAVKVKNVTVIPMGTLGVGEITTAEKNGHVGKSGKLATRILYINLRDQHIPVYGQSNQEGDSGTGATIGAAVLAGPFGLLVHGKSALIKPGTQMHVYIKEDTALPAAQ